MRLENGESNAYAEVGYIGGEQLLAETDTEAIGLLPRDPTGAGSPEIVKA
jgi:hypothetical protein